MKRTEIEQAVIELCDAVPEFSYKEFTSTVHVATLGALSFYGINSGDLPCIAQHAKHWAAKQDWMPYTNFHNNESRLYLVDVSYELPLIGKQTKLLKFDPTVLGSEELQWIRAVTEVAKLITSQGASK